MIRPIDIRLNAAHPELPLAEAVTFTGSPSTVLIRGVPPNCGRWAITAVFVAATYPDGSTTTRAAVQSANGVWVATLPATATSGRTANGLRVMADGIDENGAAVTGYILGVADFAVASLGVAPAPAPGETSWQMLYFDAVPGTLRKGDVTKIDGVLKFYDGTAWEPFSAPVTFDDAVTPTSANGVKSSGIWSAIWGALSALPTGFSSLYDWVVSQLAGKASTADATLTPIYSQTPTFSEWTFSDVSDGITDIQQPVFYPSPGGEPRWKVSFGYDGETRTATAYIGDEDATNLAFVYADEGMNLHLTATRTRTDVIGYHLGSQTDKPLASEAEVEALRQGKADRAANPTAGNLAALDANGNPTDSQIPAADVALKGNIPYTLGTPIVIDSASSEVVEGERVYYGAATLSDRTSNIVQVPAGTPLGSPLDELRITFPAATSGKVRDFGLRVEIGTGSAALAAPALVPIAPTGETIKLENNAAEIPALADGTATAKGVTLLYFSENAPGVFVVKGEQIQEVA